MHSCLRDTSFSDSHLVVTSELACWQHEFSLKRHCAYSKQSYKASSMAADLQTCYDVKILINLERGHTAPVTSLRPHWWFARRYAAQWYHHALSDLTSMSGSYGNYGAVMSPPFIPYFLHWFTFSECWWKRNCFVCLLVFFTWPQLSTANSFRRSFFFYLIKKLFAAERLSRRTLGGDRLMTVTSIMSSQALLTYRHRWRWQTRTMNNPNIGVRINRTITALLLPINHTISTTGGRHDLTIYDH